MGKKKSRKHYSMETRERMLHLKEQGLSNRGISKKLHVPRRTIDRTLKACEERGTLRPKTSPGAPIKFTTAMRHQFLLQVKRERLIFMSDMIQYIHDQLGLDLSRQKVRQILRESKIKGYTRLKKPLLNSEQKKNRLKWVKVYI